MHGVQQLLPHNVLGAVLRQEHVIEAGMGTGKPRLIVSITTNDEVQLRQSVNWGTVTVGAK